MTKILVTGANGMLGQDLCPVLEENGYEVIRTDIADLDITNIDMTEKVLNSQNPDFVIHCAAYTNVAKADAPEHVPRLGEHLGAGPAGDDARHGNVLLGGKFRQEMVELEHVAAGAVAEIRLLVCRQGKQILSAEADRTRGRSIKRAHKMQERALAGAGGSHDGELLAFVDADADFLQDLEAASALVVDLGHVVEGVELSHAIRTSKLPRA